MASEYPKYFYKYRAIENWDNLDKDYSLIGLFENKAVFSSRKNFNDLFDSKIEFIEPTAHEYNKLTEMFDKLRKNSVGGTFGNGEKIPTAEEAIRNLPQELNELVDQYPFYCVSKNPESNLMWSHYAGSHTGFCIEFRSEHLKADIVTYKKDIPRVEISDLIRLKIYPNDRNCLKKIWDALRTKLIEWEYEEEYRFQASNSMQGGGRVPEGEKHLIIPYGPEFIESVIFGCRMKKDIKEHIVKNMPKSIKYK